MCTIPRVIQESTAVVASFIITQQYGHDTKQNYSLEYLGKPLPPVAFGIQLLAQPTKQC